jgi:hypothetical protein
VYDDRASPAALDDRRSAAAAILNPALRAVVCYRVDRLTRSLTVHQLIDVFGVQDLAGQHYEHFNTATPIGR